jgi:UDP-N-acetyl-D-mannosaminuronate dehydrogenase
VSAKLSLVVGLGEVGRPLLAVLGRAHRALGSDLPPLEVREPVEFLHVCYPAEIADFVGVTAAYVERYRPELVVIHSTVAVGTTRAVQRRVGGGVPVLHSPVRGKHARMAEELLHYPKFVGGDDAAAADRVEAHFRAVGVPTRRLPTPEATELGKLTETTYFGLIIAFHQDVQRMARLAGASYDDVVSFYEGIGYLPPVKFFPGVIGGHCVLPNIALLKRTADSRLLEAIEWSNDLRRNEA